MRSRLARFKRSSISPVLRLTLRDRQIIQVVQRHRFLRSRQVFQLITGSMQHLSRRLQLLYHHGFLERPRAQIDYYGKSGSHHIVYAIGNKGVALLKGELGVAVAPVRWGEKNRSVGRIFLEHAVLVSDVMVAFELACRASKKVRFVSQHCLSLPNSTSWSGVSFKWNVNLSGRFRLGLFPDHVFGLEHTIPDGTTDRAFFFLEADRGTMPVVRKKLSQTSFYRKLLAYEATWAQRIHQKRFGFHRFRVLTVTTSKKRLESLVEACSQLKSGHGLFLFADRTILDKPADILTARWQSGRQSEFTTLLS